MIQSNRLSAKTPISLDGFEDLLDRVIEPTFRHGQVKASRRSTQSAAPNLVASKPLGEIADNVIVGPGNAMFLAVPSLPESVASENAPADRAQLAGEVRLLEARLEYALEALAEARFTEKKLKTMLAAMEDQVKQIPLLFDKAVRLRELESYLTGLIVELNSSLE